MASAFLRDSTRILNWRAVSRTLYLQVMANGDGQPIRAFLSYAHDTPGHRELVREFWFFLRRYGVDAWADFNPAEQRQEWPRTMESEVHRAEFILVIASPEYRRRSAADRPPGETVGRGVEYEAALIRERLYGDRHRWFSRVLPVILPGVSRDDVPAFLLPATSTVYWVTDFTVEGAEQLLRVLTGQPGEIVPAPGLRPHLPPRSAPTSRRERLVGDLIARLRALPAMENPRTRALFRTMVAERLPSTPAVPGDQDTDRFLQELIIALERIPGGLWALSDAIHALHRGQAVDNEVRRLVERLVSP